MTAKYAHGLIARIADYLDLPAGSVVVDPFGGVGLGGIIFASRGVRWIGVELEARFTDLAEQNFAKHAALWHVAGDPFPRIVQGDSRQLRQHVGPVLADCVVGSPPYAEAIPTRSGPSGMKVSTRADGSPMGYGKAQVQENAEGYGSTPGQLGGMPSGSVDAVVGSPPFQESISGSDSNTGIIGEKRRNECGRKTSGGPIGKSMLQSYGRTPGQLGGMPSGSVDAVVSSPPYEGSLTAGGDQFGLLHGIKRGSGLDSRNDKGSIGRSQKHYSAASSNLGNQQGETFWHAAADIVAECHAILKPGGFAVWVCKDFVRKGQRVPFSRDWATLCESQGFQLVEWIHASLVKETRNRGLFEDEVAERKERKSFFRRLAEKNGSPPIDHEDVLVMRKL